MRNKTVELMAGLFMFLGLLALVFLAFKVSGLTNIIGTEHFYTVKAEFDNIGDLLPHAPVSVSGVTVGRVVSVDLDPVTFRAKVILKINTRFNRMPKDTSASILTRGLLGSNYISLTPGFSVAPLKPGDVIETTHSALILENLIGQLLYNLKGDSVKSSRKS